MLGFCVVFSFLLYNVLNMWFTYFENLYAKFVIDIFDTTGFQTIFNGWSSIFFFSFDSSKLDALQPYFDCWYLYHCWDRDCLSIYSILDDESENLHFFKRWYRWLIIFQKEKKITENFHKLLNILQFNLNLVKNMHWIVIANYMQKSKNST